MLANGLRRRGHQVRVVTQTPAAGADSAKPPSADLDVVRLPSAARLLHELRWSEVVLQSNFSLRLAWPLICGLVSRPWVVVHHTPIARPSGRRILRDRLKLQLVNKARCYSVSSYLAAATPAPSQPLPNPYDDQVFCLLEGVQRNRDLIFAGRLVPAKGVDVLLRALHLLKLEGLEPRLSVVGDGPERVTLEQLALELGLNAQVQFLGGQGAAALARLLNEHHLLIVPSRAAPPEALGIVALEGIACGCGVIAAAQGGLPEAVGDCGVTFKSESSADLAARIRELLRSPERRTRLLQHREAHLHRFRLEQVLSEYERVLDEATSAHQLHQSRGTAKADARAAYGERA
jgi:glycosyltransferase involved in cell wall biosynthesis